VVLATVEDATEPLTPKQIYEIISKKWHITPSTVRKYLRRLHRENRVVQPYPGYYCSRITYSVIVGPLVVHDVHWKIGANFLGGLGKFGDVTELTGGVKIFVQYGRQRRFISGFVSNDVPGMSKDTLLFALNRVLDIIERDTGKVVDEEIILTTFETNKDYPGKRLDGRIASLTKRQLFDVIERVYQKDEDTVRTERKVSQDLTVEAAVDLLKGNLPDSNTAQGLKVLGNQVKGLGVSQKFGNRELVDIKSQLTELTKVFKTLIESTKIQQDSVEPSYIS